jgi:dGTPase
MATGFNLIEVREAAWLAPCAMHSAETAGRRYPEPKHAYRGPYQRDRDRLLHSAAFRRLSHKTQVFMGEMGDYHRTRLTHTLEVASIARTIARALKLNEDLVEALALAHDIGHPPFGHSGEEVLDGCLRDAGRFNHNAQALRICELLESRYPEFPGLNLSQEVLEGQANRANKAGSNANDEFQMTNHKKSNSSFVIRHSSFPLSPLLEVQVVDAADSIAYDAHDADDSLEIELLRLDELLEVPLWREARERVVGRYANLDDAQLRRAIVHELIDWQVGDIVQVVEGAIAEVPLDSVAAVRSAGVVVKPSPELAQQKIGLEQFLFDRVYRHPNVLARRGEAQQALRELFDFLIRDRAELPAKFQRIAASEGLPRAVGDYLAGMTDRFALEEHARLLAHTSPKRQRGNPRQGDV